MATDRLLWQERRIGPAADFRIDPFDEGLLYGRGLLETTRTFLGTPWLWSAHLERLLSSARALGIPLDPSRLPTADDVTAFVAALGAGDVVVRLNVSAGSATRPPTVWMIARPLPESGKGVRLATATFRVAPSDPLARFKSFNYLARRLAHQQAVAHGADAGLLLDTDGFLLEAHHANVFVRLGMQWWTPPADGPLLPGTARAQVLRLAGHGIQERRIAYADLRRASEAFVTNSVVGIEPVRAIDDWKLPLGTETLQLRERLLARAALTGTDQNGS